MQRYGEDLEETVFQLDPDTRVPQLGGSREEFDRGAMEALILSALRRASQPLTEKEIDLQVTGRTGHKRVALRRLVDRGVIVPLGKGVKGDPYRYSFPEAGTRDADPSDSRSLVPIREREQETNNSRGGSSNLVPRSHVPEAPARPEPGADGNPALEGESG